MPYNQVNELMQKQIDNKRIGIGHTYADPERMNVTYGRSRIDQKSSWPAVCLYCGKVCGGGNDWTQAADTLETAVEHRTGICIDCSTKRFPQFYTDT